MALPDNIGPVAGTSRTTGIANAAVQSNANYLGSSIDNSANLDAVADVELVYTFVTAPTVGSWQLSFLYALDGTNYEPGAGDGTGSGDVDPAAKCRVVTDDARGTSNRLFWGDVPISPYKFKPLLANAAMGQTGTATLNIITRKLAQITD